MKENFYLNKYGFCEPQIDELPKKNTRLIVVIPCFNEPDLISSLNSLLCCDFVDDIHVEVITVINSAEDCEEVIKHHNLKTLNEGRTWAEIHSNLQISFQFIHMPSLPKKHAGVGLARKIGMDEAIHRFHSIENENGIVVMFDADSICEQNYLTEIYRHFQQNPKTPGCSIHFEHPIEGTEFESDVYTGITKYELFLRYYKEGLALADLPYAFHTVGSSMAVLASAYQKQGGMNKRKAGEDFYFIQKIIELGNYTNLTSTKVIPSPRISDRVPFGTGKAIGDYVSEGVEGYLSYHSQIFMDIKLVSKNLKSAYENPIGFINELPDWLVDFLHQNEIEKSLEEIKRNSKDYNSFTKRFYKWFNAFRVLKAVHFARDNKYANIEIEIAAKELLQLDFVSTKDLLKHYRRLEIC